MASPLFNSFPDIYRRLLPELFSKDVPDESKATCRTCPITGDCAKSLAVLPISGLSPSTKCCSYQPNHVNYLVGGLLLDSDPASAEGKRRMLSRIKRQLGEPFGVSSPLDQKSMYESFAEDPSKRDPDLVCEFYDNAQGGQCTIWKHREVVCSTYFCKHVDGADGKAFWTSTKEYLEWVEDQLSRFACYRVAPELFHSSDARLLDEESSPDYEEIWGDYAGKEIEFYQDCYRQIAALKQPDLDKILGLDGIVGLEQLQDALNKIKQQELPLHLEMNPELQTIAIDDQSIGVVGYSKSDALKMYRAQFDALSEFSIGEPVVDARMRIVKSHGVNFTDSQMLELVRHRILLDF